MPAPRKFPPSHVVLAVLAIAVAGGAAIYFSVVRSGPSADEASRLIQERNVALGYLENQKLDEATSALQALADKLPDDPLPWRNLAVARVVALGDEGVETTPAAVQTALAALAEMARREGVTSSYNWLSSQVAAAARDATATQAFLDAILKAEPTSADAWFAKFRAAQLLSDRELDAAAIQDLQRACEYRPENAWLRVEWLRTVGSELLRLPEDGAAPAAGELAAILADLPEQLTQSRGSIEPFAPIIKVHTKVDALELLEETRQAAENGQWREAGRSMLTLSNVLLPHAALDRILVQRHPLEFVATDFQPQVLTNLPATGTEAAVPVVFLESQVTEVGQSPGGAKISAKGATDLALADFDLDGRLDMFVLLPGRVSVWSRGKGESWHEVAFAEVAGAEQLIVQDLDADFDETGRAVRPPAGAEGAEAPAPDLRAACPTADVDVVAYGPGGVTLLENRYEAATGAGCC